MLKRILPVACMGAFVVSIVAACGGSDDSTFGDATAGGFGGASSSGSSGLGSSSGTDPNELAACATETLTGEALPLDLYVMLDTSDSMNELVTATTSKYKAVADALKTFISDPQSAGIGVGLQFFPLLPAGTPATCTSSADCPGGTGPCSAKFCNNVKVGTLQFCDTDNDCPKGGPAPHCVPAGRCAKELNTYCPVGIQCGNDANGFDRGACVAQTAPRCSGTGADSCTASQYATPAVAIAALPAAASSFAGALAGKVPGGNTPTSAALSGAISAAGDYAKANATHTVIVVLVTDGIPNRCDANVDNIAKLAEGGVAGSPSIKTFVIGVFTKAQASTAQSNLDKIAAKGGTKSALIVTQGASTAADFAAAMDTIRGNALPCDYNVPKPESGQADYDKVNVKFTASGGGAVVIPQVGNAGACGTTTGWYYDVDPASGTPTRITLCPESCNAVKSGGGAGAKVDVLLGCKTIVR